LWTLALAVAVLWPGRVLSSLDGVPLNGHAEAVVFGIVFPALCWIDGGFLRRPLVQGTVAALLVLKVAAYVVLPQHGLCARFSTAAPFSGVSSTMPIDEPGGVLRSWDVRADWRADAPRCTAMFDRAYRSRPEFPTWFVNLLRAIRPDTRDVSLDVVGYLSVDRPGTFAVETGQDMVVSGAVGNARVASAQGASIVVPLAAGSHAVDLHVAANGDRWQFVPLWNGQDAWRSIRMTASMPSWLDRWASGPVGLATTAIVLLLVTAWSASALMTLGLSRQTIIWSIVTAVLLLLSGVFGRFERFAGLLLVGSAFVPIARRQRNIRTAFVLVGIPWLAFFVGHSWAQVGQVTLYSLDDDWHVYQSAAYRIFMNGYWIQGGSPTFYFQPLYRWVAGALHMMFGDSSVGETYWDAWCLLAAALMCFAIVKRVSGFRWGVAAAALTLATFTTSSIWYLIGRGLSEITAVGWMSFTAVFLMRARLGPRSPALVAGLFAVLMFYTRLNHLLLAGFLLAWLLPVRAQARWTDVWEAVRRVPTVPATIYVVTVAAGVLLFAAHTWWYAGRFSVLYGTSFGVQQTGLRLTTIGSSTVWAKIVEALDAQLWMREPPAIDPRSALVFAGAVLSLLAVVQVPYVNRLPASLAIVTLGAIAGSFFAHTHEYPGRMSVHLVPFAVGMTVCAASLLLRPWTDRVQRVS
jgi:hypothetical protein